MSTRIKLPLLVSFCQSLELRTNRHCRAVADDCANWVQRNRFLGEDELRALPGLQLGLFASLSYPTCDRTQLQNITYLLVVLGHFVHASPIRNNTAADSAFDQLWACLIRSTSAVWQQRFQRHYQAFRGARALSATDNEQLVIPDLESYVALRRDSSGVKILLDLIEYSAGLRIPDRIYAAPMLQQLRTDVCNIISWSTDIASYVRQHSDRHNLVVVLMAQRRLTAQGAVTAAGRLVKETIANFFANEASLLAQSFGHADADVRRYAQGLRDCIVGSTHWLYETDWFFGENAEDVRELGWVFLSPN
ncbi:terpenoid synthase [Wolfiporia cocos MD-104 SS10]|uniref:Terpene synthase n=1 Tax=Wolfiporia cocos (strain MD-104) TaxID=742152 RepID=A0A2H3IXZ4_WOLCO|nr:terpenoid synthase [Wolfiporia cocos MD-104 SS10]